MKYFIRPCILSTVLTVWIVCALWENATVVLGNDESFTWRATDLPYLDMLRAVAADGTPPLHYVLVKAWRDVFGDSALALRSLSTIAALVSIVLVYLLAASDHIGGKSIVDCERARNSGFLAVVLVSLSANVFVQATTCRFYAIAFLFVALSQLLLLRAIGSNSGWLRWGFVLGLSMLTHPFGIFTFAAQCLFIVLYIADRASRRLQTSSVRAGLVLGVLCALATYSSWLPILLVQSRDVYADFWIPPINFPWVISTVSYLTWSIGGNFGSAAVFCGSGLLLLLIGWRLASLLSENSGRDTGAIVSSTDALFLCNFIVPFALCVGISYLSGRTVLQDRYLVMSQVGLICFVSRALVVVNTAWLRGAAIGLAVLAGLLGWSNQAHARYLSSIGVAESIEMLVKSCDRTDGIVTHTPWDLNVCKYYLSRMGKEDLSIVFVSYGEMGASSAGHQGHTSVLEARDVVIVRSSNSLPFKRIWVWNGQEATDPPPLPFGYVKTNIYRFSAVNPHAYEIQECIKGKH